jgi:hypothetical protein
MSESDRLITIAACTELIYRYAYFADFGQRTRIPGLFAEDGMLAFSDQRLEGRAALESFFAVDRLGQATRHVCSNVLVDAHDPGAAAATTYFTVWLHQGPVDPQAPISPPALIGHYEDAFVRSDDGWRFRQRLTNLDFRTS